MLLSEHLEFLPTMHHRAGADFRDVLDDAFADSLPGSNPDMLQEGARHIVEERLSGVEQKP